MKQVSPYHLVTVCVAAAQPGEIKNRSPPGPVHGCGWKKPALPDSYCKRLRGEEPVLHQKVDKTPELYGYYRKTPCFTCPLLAVRRSLHCLLSFQFKALRLCRLSARRIRVWEADGAMWNTPLAAINRRKPGAERFRSEKRVGCQLRNPCVRVPGCECG